MDESVDLIPYRSDRLIAEICKFLNYPSTQKKIQLQSFYNSVCLRSPLEIPILNSIIEQLGVELKFQVPLPSAFKNLAILHGKREPCAQLLQVFKDIKTDIWGLRRNNNYALFRVALMDCSKNLPGSYIMMREWIVRSTNWSKDIDFLEKMAPIHYLVQLLKYQIALYIKNKNIQDAVFEKTTLDKLLKKETVWMYDANLDDVNMANLLQNRTDLSFGFSPKIFQTIVSNSLDL